MNTYADVSVALFCAHLLSNQSTFTMTLHSAPSTNLCDILNNLQHESRSHSKPLASANIYTCSLQTFDVFFNRVYCIKFSLIQPTQNCSSTQNCTELELAIRVLNVPSLISNMHTRCSIKQWVFENFIQLTG